MGCLGNILWFVFGGAIAGIGWLICGCLWCITIIGIPIGIQCFKIARLTLFPFGADVQYGGGFDSLILNILWLLLSGVELAAGHMIIGLVLCVTIIGIPFGIQQFKLAKLALMPFGTRVY